MHVKNRRTLFRSADGTRVKIEVDDWIYKNKDLRITVTIRGYSLYLFNRIDKPKVSEVFHFISPLGIVIAFEKLLGSHGKIHWSINTDNIDGTWIIWYQRTYHVDGIETYRNFRYLVPIFDTETTRSDTESISVFYVWYFTKVSLSVCCLMKLSIPIQHITKLSILIECFAFESSSSFQYKVY